MPRFAFPSDQSAEIAVGISWLDWGRFSALKMISGGPDEPLLSWVACDEFAVWAMHGFDKASAVPKETENTEANGHFFMRRSPKHVVTMVNGLHFFTFRFRWLLK